MYIYICIYARSREFCRQAPHTAQGVHAKSLSHYCCCISLSLFQSILPHCFSSLMAGHSRIYGGAQGKVIQVLCIRKHTLQNCITLCRSTHKTLRMSRAVSRNCACEFTPCWDINIAQLDVQLPRSATFMLRVRISETVVGGPPLQDRYLNDAHNICIYIFIQ